MPIYIAFLRGINVGGQKKIKMDELRDIFESLGFHNVQTYIQSGNVIFETTECSDLPEIIEKKLEEVLGYKVTAIVRTVSELEEVIKENPFATTHNLEKQHVTFLSKEPAKELIERLMSFKNDIDEFRVVNQEVYLVCGNGYGRTKFTNNFLERKLGVLATTRNWKTVNKLLMLSKSQLNYTEKK